ncbi:CLUMA_CG007862, isoform B [Clunio marinus]|uniref:Metalloendopeptidase n=1 Tax=Clunio marinus TaxID=568069 RepID=A0A1J1I420_9DIPT|nr:CLUMA_CG007862, isoform B [Clunio marinus]
MAKFLQFVILVALSIFISAKPLAPGVGMFGDKFQGDIKLTDEQKELIFGTPEGRNSRTGWTWLPFRWPKNGQGQVIIPYRITASQGFQQDQINWMLREFADIERATCVRFVQHTTQTDFVDIVNGDGCWSWMGRTGGRQELSLDTNGCFWDGTAMHEAIHAIGFDHMHADVTRDSHVSIMWNNIQPGMESAFNMVDPQWFSSFGTSYDLWSVMHYPRWAFSRNGQDTVVPHDRSFLDIIGETGAVSSAKPLAPGVGMFGDKFQGDMKMTPEQKERIFGKSEGRNSRTGATWASARWPRNAQGQVIVPYRITASQGFQQHQINWMLREFADIERVTCVRFVQRTTQVDFVDIVNGDGCWSWIGRIGGRQELSMDTNGCFWDGTAMHEAIHALGFVHMHSDVTRDSHVSIMWNNIIPGFEDQFEMVDPRWYDSLGTPYDLRSIMHYPRWAFSRNGQDTVVPHNRSFLDIIGMTGAVSSGDALRINRLYGC